METATMRFLVSVFLCVALATGSLQSSRLDDLEQEVEQLETEQASLEARLQQQEEFNQELLAAFSTLVKKTKHETQTTSSSHGQSSTTTSRPEEDVTRNRFIVTPLSVKRETTATGHRYTVRYVPRVDGVKIVYPKDSIVTSVTYQAYDYLKELHGIPDGDGVMKVTFDWNFPPPPHVTYYNDYVYFMKDAERFRIRMNRQVDTNEPLYANLTAPPFTVTPPTELIYNVGEDTPTLSINLTTSSTVFLEARLLNLDTYKLRHDLNLESYFSKAYYSRGYKVLSGSLPTSVMNETGYINIQVTTFLRDTAVEMFDVMRQVSVHPDNQVDPFPRGYVGFVESNADRMPGDGSGTIYCQMTASRQCHGVVELITAEDGVQLRCNMMDAEGHLREPLIVTPPSDLAFDKYRKTYLVLIGNPNGSLESRRIKCIASSGSDGTTRAETTKLVYFYNKSHILLNSSHAELVEGDPPMLNVTCAAIGAPLPSLMAQVEIGGYDYQHFVYHDLTHTQTPENATVISASGSFRVGEGKPLRSVICSATQMAVVTAAEHGYTIYLDNAQQIIAEFMDDEQVRR